MYEEDQIVPESSLRRFAKVTLYLEVPSTFNEGSLENYVNRVIDDKLFDDKIVSTAPCEVVISEPGSDNPDDFESPVGFIAPDGKFYLVESSSSGLAHLELAPFVEQLYRDKGMLDDMYLYRCGMTLDYELERAGFVKVHKYDVRYFAHMNVGKNYKTGEDVYSPDLTQAQVDAIVRYGEIHGYEGCVFVNGTLTEISKIKQADKLSLRKIFSL